MTNTFSGLIKIRTSLCLQGDDTQDDATAYMGDFPATRLLTPSRNMTFVLQLLCSRINGIYDVRTTPTTVTYKKVLSRR